jgi:hypothetical protein
MSKHFKKPPVCEAARVQKDCRATGKKNLSQKKYEFCFILIIYSEMSDSGFGRFSPAADAHWKGGFLSRSERGSEEKDFCSCQKSNPSHLRMQ